MWNPDFSQLSRATVWLVAAGQIFFTLSLGQGIINTYASYLREKDDVTLNGLSTSMTNEFAEVILGGTIAIPVAVAFFGVVETKLIASEGAFNLGFQSLPVIFQKIPLGQVFGAMWFFLLFIAGITSSVAMTSPAVAFLEDEFKWKRDKAVNAVFAVMAACAVLVVAFFKFGFLDELDFWAGTFGLVVFATIEIIIFSWIFGVKKGWEEMHLGADLKVPKIFKFILKYVTPVYMLVVLGAWTYQEAIAKFLMKGEEASRHPYLWGARAMFVGLILLTVLMVWLAWRKKKNRPGDKRNPGRARRAFPDPRLTRASSTASLKSRSPRGSRRSPLRRLLYASISFRWNSGSRGNSPAAAAGRRRRDLSRALASMAVSARPACRLYSGLTASILPRAGDQHEHRVQENDRVGGEPPGHQEQVGLAALHRLEKPLEGQLDQCAP